MNTWQITWGIAVRSLKLIPRMPSTFVPALVMPVFFTVAFAGQYSGLVDLPGFPGRNILDWFIPFNILMGCGFAGVTTGMGVARDIENGFYDRLLLSPASRPAILMGPMLAALLRSFFPIVLLLLIAFPSGANLPGGPLGIVPVVVASLGIGVIAAAWSIALALKFQSQAAAPIMQLGLFATMFLSTAQMPLNLLTGWMHTVATFNPISHILQLARQGFLGDVTWGTTWPGLVALTGLAVAMLAFAARAMHRLPDTRKTA